VLDLHIVHERWGSSSDPSLNGHLHYPNDLDGTLNETVTEQLMKYDNTTLTIIIVPLTISPLDTISGTSGHLQCEFVGLLFLQVHRETDRFFAVSGLQLP
jgi:hypothetical protein